MLSLINILLIARSTRWNVSKQYNTTLEVKKSAICRQMAVKGFPGVEYVENSPCTFSFTSVK